MNLEIKKALSFHQKGYLREAEELYLDILSNTPKDPGILQLLGTLYLQKNDIKLSKDYLIKSFNIDPNNPSTLNNLGNLEKKLNNHEKANEYFQKNIDKNNFLASWINKSNILLQLERFEEGLEFIKKAIKNYPENTKLRNNYAVFLFNCGFKKECLDIYKDFDVKKIHFSNSYINYSKILYSIKSYKESLFVINTLLFENDKNVTGLRHRFLIYKDLNELDKAEADILKAYKINNSDIVTNRTLVEFYVDTKKFDKAITYCDLMIERNIDLPFFLMVKINCKIHLGFWRDLLNDLDLFKNKIDNKTILRPLSLKYFSDDANLHKTNAENYWVLRSKTKQVSHVVGDFVEVKTKKKIRIGYFSGDFRKHAIFNLIQDLFLYHNKSIFEIYAYSSFKEEGPEREKVKKNVDFFFDIDDKSNSEIINLIQSHSLDIAIDLSGFTMRSKSELFNFDIAKKKINYLGYPGTMGTKKYNYIIADKVIIPEQDKNFYSETVLYLKENYQPFTPISFKNNFDRSNFNLPKKAFILGCLSRIEKIMPNIFNIWMEILKKYSDTYLALYILDLNVKKNIKNYCDENDFDFERIIFLDHVNHLENLKRISTFDLYLDTYPYNGHTGISDSLFQSCVPTISYNGNSFASRVSKSLLSTLNLENLITTSEKEYQKKIDFYCSNRTELKKIRDYLLEYKETNFDRMKSFTKDFENLMLSLLKY